MAAEKIYRMEVGGYYGSAVIANLNTYLKLMLSTAADRKWNYQTQVDNTVVPAIACTQATRTDTGARTWRLRNTEDAPVSGSVCP
jgi:hypothetical protein